MHIPFNSDLRSFFENGTYQAAQPLKMAGSYGLAGLGDTSTTDSSGNIVTTTDSGEVITTDINGNVLSVTSGSSSGSIIGSLSSAIPALLNAEAAQNVISQQNNAANALLAVNTARAQQGLAPLASLSPITGTVSTISPMMMLLIAGALVLMMARR